MTAFFLCMLSLEMTRAEHLVASLGLRCSQNLAMAINISMCGKDGVPLSQRNLGINAVHGFETVVACRYRWVQCDIISLTGGRIFMRSNSIGKSGPAVIYLYKLLHHYLQNS